MDWCVFKSFRGVKLRVEDEDVGVDWIFYRSVEWFDLVSSSMNNSSPYKVASLSLVLGIGSVGIADFAPENLRFHAPANFPTNTSTKDSARIPWENPSEQESSSRVPEDSQQICQIKNTCGVDTVVV